ncbi:LysR family transcriptional regulator [Ruegeria sp.]|uniref:LysR family transcriptional regulator n=1 Tax=Ruegeria sp. TaxID=1879320 RepID=UPI002324261E|nr:LysR family transcriptional regulator [Ruegeria sp.]MDA7966708.1 LysR family transcriptional regulator [Ruegeria sp.]
MDLHLLRVFRAVVDAEGITAAEKTLGVGRSTISRQISELETRLGITLCERGRSGFRLTQEGRIVLEQLMDLLGSIEHFRRSVSEIHDILTGELVLAIADSFVTANANPLPDILRRYGKQAPNVKLKLRKVSPNNMERELVQRRCHIALKPVYAELPGFHYQSLYTEKNQLYCSVSHPLATGPTRSLSDLRQQRFATLSYKSGFVDVLDRIGTASSAEANDLEGLAYLILSGQYVGFLPEHYAQNLVADGFLAPIATEKLDYSVPFKAICLEHEEKSLTARLFLSLLDETFLSKTKPGPKMLE